MRTEVNLFNIAHDNKWIMNNKGTETSVDVREIVTSHWKDGK